MEFHLSPQSAPMPVYTVAAPVPSVAAPPAQAAAPNPVPQSQPDIPKPDLNKVSGKRRSPSGGSVLSGSEDESLGNSEDEDPGEEHIPGKHYGRWGRDEHNRFLEGTTGSRRICGRYATLRPALEEG